MLTIVAAVKGWDPAQLKGAFAHELPPTGEVRVETLAKNERLHAAAAHLLAPLDSDVVRVLIGASSHMTAALRLVSHAGSNPMSVPELPEEFHVHTILDDGKLSQSKVLRSCPGMCEYLELGIPYLVIRHQLVALCPKLISVMSTADNAGHDVYRREL